MSRAEFKRTRFSLVTTVAQAIDAPSDPRGTEVGQSLVKWEWNSVPGAVSYDDVIVDGIFAGTTTDAHYSLKYHVYAVKWEAGRVTWYIDDQQVSVLKDNEINFEELYVKLNVAMGGNWTNLPANAGGPGRAFNDHFPNQNDLDNFSNPALEIDYVRVYRAK